MDRIAEAFSKNGKDGRDARFISYVCAGDPDFDTSIEICRALVEGGVDILELGVPFSDPLADGAVNQLAAERALKAGMTQARVLEFIRKVRSFTDKPIVLYTYYNMVFSPGVENYVWRAHEAGADALLTLDCPPEEARELLAASETVGVKNIFIIAPTTPPQRMDLIARNASGFIYYVSREGVTGVRADLEQSLEKQVLEIKKHTDLPVAVGFGISTAAHVAKVASVAEGVVVGSALVRCIEKNADKPEAAVASLKETLAELMRGFSKKHV